MSGIIRITIDGVLSERFCRGFAGMRRRVDAGQTVLEGDPGGRSLTDLLTSLGNLGVDVVRVEAAGDPPDSPED